jgi:magnesium transporter
VTKKLAGWAALIAIPTLIAGIYGMNFEVMPELKWAYGYLFALGLMVGADFVLFWWFRKIRWL